MAKEGFNTLVKGCFMAIFCCLNLVANAQDVTGKVVDEQSCPIAYANVILQEADSSYVEGTTTNAEGMFSLPWKDKARLVRISFIGYKTICKEVGRHDLGTLQMQPDDKMLGEVVIKGTKPVIKREIDRRCFAWRTAQWHREETSWTS